MKLLNLFLSFFRLYIGSPPVTDSDRAESDKDYEENDNIPEEDDSE
jgi:hypothetical protein